MELNTKNEDRVRIVLNTKKAYASDLAYIQQWARITFKNFSFPMTEREILFFITDHLQGMQAEKEKQLMSPIIRNGYKAKLGLHSLATVRRRLSTLTIYHREQGYKNPCSGKKVKHLLRAISKTEKKATQQKTVTRDVLEKLLATCDGSVKGIRDKAILLLAWASGGRRRSEVTAAQVEHLISMGNDFLLHIPTQNPKTDCKVPVNGRASQLLRDWMTVAAIKQGPIFRSVGKSGRVSGNPLSPIDINRIVKNRCKVAGLDEKQFGAHSLRSGFLAQLAMESGVGKSRENLL